MAVVCPPHVWGPTTRSEASMRGGETWHWCACVRCGAAGFRVNGSAVVRTWQQGDEVIVP